MEPNSPVANPNPAAPEPQPSPAPAAANQTVPPAQPAWTPDMAVTPPPPGTVAAAPGTIPPAYISNPFALIKPSWNAVRLNIKALLFPALFIVLGLILLVAFGVGGAFLGSAASGGLRVGIFALGVIALIAFLVFIVILAPYTTIVLLASARGQKVTFKESFTQSRRLAGKFFVLGLLAGLAILGGLILLIIPGLIFAAWFSLSSFVMVSENLGAVDSMKKSKALVQGHLVEMWGLLGFSTALNILGLIPVLGSIISLLISLAYSAAPAIRYQQLTALKASGAPKPKVHWANYVVIVLALISGPSQALRAPKATTNTPTLDLPSTDTTVPTDNQAQ